MVDFVLHICMELRDLCKPDVRKLNGKGCGGLNPREPYASPYSNKINAHDSKDFERQYFNN